MKKTEFIYAKRMVKHIFAWAIAIFGLFTLSFLKGKFFGMHLNGILSFLVEFLLIFCFLSILSTAYRYIDRHNLFQCKGYYWVSNGVVYIQTKKETYSLENIECVCVSDWSFPGDFRHGQLTIKLKDNKLVFSSLPKYTIETFFDCDLAPLLDTILANNPQLIKDEDLDLWEAKSTADA